ncbi:MAG: ComEC/Rec2 family competence protein, partial [Candidatus Eremiobacteraeota bacterium]|nr:ComEC/Rec2 family competence protein [Candidatus Eremiobacteraeota bacterium]
MPAYALLLCSTAAVLGTLAVASLSFDLRLVAVCALAALTACAAFGRSPLRLIPLLTACFALAALNAALHERLQPPVVEQRTARYGATLLDSSSVVDGSTALTLELDDGLYVLARIHESPPVPGSRVVIRGRLEPFDEPRNPDEPSDRAIQRERGFDAQLDGARILSSTPGVSIEPRALLARTHSWAHAQLRDRLGEPAASVLAGELWGERSALPPELRKEFQETGTVHVLVTAGLHLGAVAALCAAALTALALPRWMACLCAIALVWSFVAWSGAQLPAVRAATMVTAALASRACGRATFSWNSLAIAALVLAYARPASVATTSFALSFSCVGAIFACAGPMERWLEARIALPDRLREAFVLSLATQLGIWPLGAATFLQFTPYAVAANLAVVPCVAATMALGALQLALAWCGPLAQAAANCNSWLLAWMLGVVATLSALPGAAIAMTPAPAWCIAAYDVAIVAAPFLWRRGAQTLAAAAVILAASNVLWPPRALDTRLRVTLLDVGQADAIVVQTPRGHVVLVDAGGRLERGTQNSESVAEAVGERVVVPFLLRHGIHALDAIVLSHPHGDHAGGVAPALRHLRVDRLADGGQRYGGHAYQDALATARAEAVPIVYPRAGMEWRTDDGVSLHFLGPSLPFIANSRNDINENSVAFTLRYQSFCMLFTGDAGAAAEERFLA